MSVGTVGLGRVRVPLAVSFAGAGKRVIGMGLGAPWVASKADHGTTVREDVPGTEVAS